MLFFNFFNKDKDIHEESSTTHSSCYVFAVGSRSRIHSVCKHKHAGAWLWLWLCTLTSGALTDHGCTMIVRPWAESERARHVSSLSGPLSQAVHTALSAPGGPHCWSTVAPLPAEVTSASAHA